MSTKSAIEWTDATWNPVVGCTRVSAGCDNCYAVRTSFRLERMNQVRYRNLTVVNPRGERHFNGTVRTVPEALRIPMRWKQPRKVFVNSMSDLFHPAVPFDFVDKVFAVMALAPQHAFQILTKRPERMATYCSFRNRNGGCTFFDSPIETHYLTDAQLDRVRKGFLWPLPNAWLGTSCEDQATADERIPHLLKCPAAVRFVSAEPLLGPIDLNHEIGGTRWIGGQRGCGGTHVGVGTPECPRERHHHHDSRCNPGIDWVIIGGESGPGARPCDVAWIRSIRDQCKAAGVPCFVKQLGRDPYDITRSPHKKAVFTADELKIREHRETAARILGEICEAAELRLRDPKGGDMDEWPEDLRVREFPK